MSKTTAPTNAIRIDPILGFSSLLICHLGASILSRSTGNLPASFVVVKHCHRGTHRGPKRSKFRTVNC
jgi:hypothetical protein